MPRHVYELGGHADHRLDALLLNHAESRANIRQVADLDPNSRLLWHIEAADLDEISTDPVEVCRYRQRWPWARVTVTSIDG